MRVHYFFMKFIRSFLIGFGCASAALVLIASAALAAYCMYFV